MADENWTSWHIICRTVRLRKIMQHSMCQLICASCEWKIHWTFPLSCTMSFSFVFYTSVTCPSTFALSSLSAMTPPTLHLVFMNILFVKFSFWDKVSGCVPYIQKLLVVQNLQCLLRISWSFAYQFRPVDRDYNGCCDENVLTLEG